MNISIDIGTSHSSVFYLDAANEPQPVNVRTGMSMYGSDYSLPSAIYVDPEGHVLVGQAAMNSRKLDPSRFRAEFKRELGQDVPILLGERSMLPEEMYTEIFRHLKSCAEKAANQPVDKAFITHPASFSLSKKQKMREAAEAAGLYNVTLLDEPTAAAMCYCADGKIENGQTLLVYDFGGGTFDAALIRYENGNYRSVVDAVGLERCGGIDIDRAIYADMMAAASPVVEEMGLTQNKLRMLRFQAMLSELALKAKCHLTSASSFEEGISIGFDFVSYSLTVERLNGMIAGLVQQTIDCCQQLLKNAGLAISDVDCILLVGGTSRVPLVEQMVRQFAKGVPVLSNVNPELAVAQGALSVVKKAAAKPAPEPEPVIQSEPALKENPSKQEIEKQKRTEDLIAALKKQAEQKSASGKTTGVVEAPPSTINHDLMKRIASTSNYDFAITPDGHVVRTTPAAFFAFFDGNLFRNYTSSLTDMAEICCIAGNLDEDVLFRTKNGRLVTQQMSSIENKPSELLTKLLATQPMRLWEACTQFRWLPFQSNTNGLLIGVQQSGTLLVSDASEPQARKFQTWTNVKKLVFDKAGNPIGLSRNGTLLNGNNPKPFNAIVDIVSSPAKAVEGEPSFAALHADGTVSVYGSLEGREEKFRQLENVAAMGFGGATYVVLFRDGRLMEIFSNREELKLENCIAFRCSDTMNHLAVDKNGNAYTWGCFGKRKNEVARWPKLI